MSHQLLCGWCSGVLSSDAEKKARVHNSAWFCSQGLRDRIGSAIRELEGHGWTCVPPAGRWSCLSDLGPVTPTDDEAETGERLADLIDGKE